MPAHCGRKPSRPSRKTRTRPFKPSRWSPSVSAPATSTSSAATRTASLPPVRNSGPRRASMRELQDEASKPIGERLYHAAIEAEYNELVYMWPLPGEEEPTKKSLVTKVEANTRRAVVEPSPSRGRSATVLTPAGQGGAEAMAASINGRLSQNQFPPLSTEVKTARRCCRLAASVLAAVFSIPNVANGAEALPSFDIDLAQTSVSRALVRGVHGGTISCRIFGHGDRGRDHCRGPTDAQPAT